MRGREKTPKIGLTNDEKLVIEKLVKISNVKWWLRIIEIDKPIVYNKVLIYNDDYRKYPLELYTAIKRLILECNKNQFNMLSKEEQSVFNHLTMNKLHIILLD